MFFSKFTRLAVIRFALVIIALLSLIFVLLAVSGNSAPSDGVQSADADLVKQDTSDTFVFPFRFSTEDLYGNMVTEDSLGEKELFFVHYWATWCGPCVIEMPNLAKIEEKYGERVGFIALLDDYGSAKTTAIRIAESSGVTFTMVDAKHNSFRTLLKMVRSGYIPTTVLIDGSGNIVGEQIIGAVGEGYEKFIDNALQR